MKRIICLSFGLFASLGVLCMSTSLEYYQSPSLYETLEWLESKIEAYPLCEGLCYSAQVSYNIDKKKVYVIYTSSLGNRVAYEIPLQYISPSGYSYTKGFLFTLKTTANLIRRIDTDSNGKSTVSYDDAAYLVFDNIAFQSNNLYSRLKKAFNHAARLSGANISSEPF